MDYEKITIIIILLLPLTAIVSVFWHFGKVLAIRILFRKDGENGSQS